ncbi:MAG: trypsin-like peptidase domain-containing protein [Candidatus Sungiibacteriota bacterium]|uniref:Trypsin-like peptidase domain-containing protein n=1 Tax=Candidatus Sungiibacteriota bacterium TaxID=2750080 RepID=A0A7T5RJ10_9BACT|nr:MAG: trypsin-like peptidase domain-containing protein [Candidatus Sungbacteria bacterium]
MSPKKWGLCLVILILTACGNTASQFSLPDLVKHVTPSVVIIIGDLITDTEGPPSNPSSEKKSDIFSIKPSTIHPILRKESADTEYTKRIVAAGSVQTKDGFILTVSHAVVGVLNLRALFYDGTTFPLELVANDGMDAAIVKIKTDKKISFRPLVVTSAATLQNGQNVFGIGHPFAFYFSTIHGVVSRTFTTENTTKNFGFPENARDKIIHLDMLFNPGVSGAPIFNMNGEMLAMAFGMIANANSPGFAFLAEPIIQYFRSKGVLPMP